MNGGWDVTAQSKERRSILEGSSIYFLRMMPQVSDVPFFKRKFIDNLGCFADFNVEEANKHQCWRNFQTIPNPLISNANHQKTTL